jgi:uncharacterized protein YacL
VLLRRSNVLYKRLVVGDFLGLLEHNEIASPTATLSAVTPMESTMACTIAVLVFVVLYCIWFVPTGIDDITHTVPKLLVGAIVGGKLGLEVGNGVGKLAFSLLNIGAAENNNFLLLTVGIIVLIEGTAVG